MKARYWKAAALLSLFWSVAGAFLFFVAFLSMNVFALPDHSVHLFLVLSYAIWCIWRIEKKLRPPASVTEYEIYLEIQAREGFWGSILLLCFGSAMLFCFSLFIVFFRPAA